MLVIPTSSGVQVRPPRPVMSPFVHSQIPQLATSTSFTTTVRVNNSIHYQRLFTLYTLPEGYERGDSDWVEIYGANRCQAVSRGKMGRAAGEGRGTSSTVTLDILWRCHSHIYAPSVIHLCAIRHDDPWNAECPGVRQDLIQFHAPNRVGPYID